MQFAGESLSSADQEISPQLDLKYKPVAERYVVAFAGLVGLILALAAPGLEQWYFSWFVFSAVLVMIVTANEPWRAGMRGLVVGFTYHLVYLSWFLTFRPIFCEGTFVFCPQAITAMFWVLTSYFEGLLIAVPACVIRAVPLAGGWLPQKHQGRWRLPSFVAVPILWLLVDRMCHTTQMLGFPWASLQYGQYKQLLVLQATSLIGGTGLAAWIVLVNLNLAVFLAKLPVVQRLFASSGNAEVVNAFTFKSRRALIANTAVTAILSLALLVFGQYRLSQEQAQLATKPKVMVGAIQIGRTYTVHRLHPATMFAKYFQLAESLPPKSVCIWPEWALPLNFSSDKEMVSLTAKRALQSSQDWVLGCFDTDSLGRKFNSVCGIGQDGVVLPEAYHKRYLVPVGEYTPDWIRNSPIGVLLYGPDKKYNDSSSGEKPMVFDLKGARVAPLVCFECAYPKICSQAVLAGGELLTDSSDNSWFCRSILSDQMVAFCVMRAAENHRSFVFSTALGPSAIIDSTGHVLRLAAREEPATINCEVPIERDITPFTRWCF